MKMRALMVLMMVTLLAGCASKVVTDYNSQAAFNSFHSWAFAPKKDETAFLSLDGARVENVLERELTAKNLQKKPESEADLLVSYQVVEEDKIESYGFSYGVGFSNRPFGWGISTAPPVRQVKEGKLVVELVDSGNDQVVWRAISKRYLNEDQSPEYRSELIDETVTEMFTRYPPEAN